MLINPGNEWISRIVSLQEGVGDDLDKIRRRRTTEAGIDTVFHNARLEDRAGNSHKALAMLHPHHEHLNDEQKKWTTSLANKNFNQLHNKHTKDGSLSEGDHSSLVLALHHADPHHLINRLGDSRHEYNGKTNVESKPNAVYVRHYNSGGQYHNPTRGVPAWSARHIHPNGKLRSSENNYYSDDQLHNQSPTVPAVQFRYYYSNGRPEVSTNTHYFDDNQHSPSPEEPSSRTVKWHANGQKSSESAEYHQHGIAHDTPSGKPAFSGAQWNEDGSPLSDYRTHHRDDEGHDPADGAPAYRARIWHPNGQLKSIHQEHLHRGGLRSPGPGRPALSHLAFDHNGVELKHHTREEYS